MSKNKKQVKFNGYYLIIFSIAFLVLTFFILKVLIVNKKWKNISKIELVDLEDKNTSHNSNSSISLITKTRRDTLNIDLDDSLNTYSEYKYHLEFYLKKANDVLEWRIGLVYPEGFILKSDKKIVCTSPNVYCDQNDNYIVVYDHPYEVASQLEYFYINNSPLNEGSNKFELTLIVQTSSSKTNIPEIRLDVLRSGYFISSFQKIKIYDEDIFSNSKLKELHINTAGKKILDDPKIKATLTIKSVDSTYSSNIKIEKRGHSSQEHGLATFSYSIELYDENWKKQNLGLLELPEESSWVLYTPSMDKSLLRNALTYSLYSKTGNYSPRFKYCNLFIDDKYVGLYLLTEKPELDKNRIDYSETRKKDVFLCSIDYAKENKFRWELERNGNRININVLSPDIEDLNEEEKEYITNCIEVLNNEFNKPQLNYSFLDSLLDTDAFIEYILIHELAKNLDAYRLSSYFSKSPQHPLKFGPVWDFDLAYGNALMGRFSEIVGWCYESDKEFATPLKMLNWAEIFLSDSVYQKRIKHKWNVYRKSILSDNSILACIDSLNLIINDDVPHHFNAINYLNQWVWPNTYIGGSHYKEVFYLKSWILSRAYWIDEEMNKF